MLLVKVRATCAVLGMFPGNEYEVEPSARVEKLIQWGHLVLIDDIPEANYG